MLSLVRQAWAAADNSITIKSPQAPYIGSIGALLSGVTTIAIIFGALAVFIYLLWGGFEWLTSGGDSGKIENAQKKITSALIGFAIIAAAFGIMKLVAAFFGLSDLFSSGGLNVPDITTGGAE